MSTENAVIFLSTYGLSNVRFLFYFCFIISLLSILLCIVMFYIHLGGSYEGVSRMSFLYTKTGIWIDRLDMVLLELPTIRGNPLMYVVHFIFSLHCRKIWKFLLA